ncbi:MAG: hypothetical protein AVDCRST_MAG66-2840, partial [uncultured Pseudonocardia sp.]
GQHQRCGGGRRAQAVRAAGVRRRHRGHPGPAGPPLLHRRAP